MTPEQQKYFKNRKISDEVIKQNLLGYAPPGGRWLVQKLYERTGVKDRELILSTGLFFESNRNTLRDRYQDRYIFPYWFRGQPVFSIGRSINPQIEDYKKYVKHLVQSEKHPFVSDLAVRHVLWGEDTIKQGDKIIVAEGIVDAILANQHFGNDYTIVSPVTISWTNDQIERLAAPTGKVKEIIFVADSDSSEAGERGAVNTAKKLMRKWKEIAKNNPSAFNQRVDNKTGETVTSYPEIRIARLRRPPEETSVDLSDYIQRGLIYELEYWIKAAKGLQYEDARLANNPKRFFSYDRHGGYLPKRMADEISLDNEFFIWTAEQLYRYEQGVYRDTGENFVMSETQKRLGEMSKNRHGKETIDYFKTRDRIEAKAIKQNKYILNIKNGLFDIRTSKLKPHTPYYHSITRIAVTYKPDAAYEINPNTGEPVINPETQKPKLTNATREIQRFIASVVPIDCIDLIYEIAGYCLYTDTNYEKNFMFLGEGANGKSTLLNLITALIGNENVTHIPLQELDENRFKRAEIFGKLANVFADISASEIKNSTYLKMIASGDQIDGKRKNRDLFFFKPYSKLLFSANTAPRTNDRTHGFYRKWEFIPFPNKFEGQEKNVDMRTTLTTEENLSAFFNLAIIGINRIFRKNGFTSSKFTMEEMEKYKSSNDSVYAFTQEYIKEETGSTIRRQELYETYKQFCEDNGNKPVSQIKFNNQLQSAIPSAIKARDTKSQSRDQIWRNITLTT
jgi:putative DNA primase/helicase